jgi:hypothetical protein
MKHLLNDLSNEEKNSIREQHTGGMKVMTENFSKLLNSKLGDAKPLVSEQETPTELIIPNKEYFVSNPSGTLVVGEIGSVLDSVNGLGVEEGEGGMNSDQVIKMGTYEYKYEPSVKTMRAPNGEPAVKLFQSGTEIDYFMPKQ